MIESDKISIVIPVYGCSESLNLLCDRLQKTLLTITKNYEIILVNDASPDNPWNTILELSKQNNNIRGINFSKNFGQHYAITAGLRAASGNWVVVMDCDLQDKPEEIIKLYQKAQEGYDIVFGQRKIRRDNFFKRMGSKMFYALLSYLTGTDQDPSVANFGIYNKKTIDAVLSMNDKLKYFPVMIRWVGFKTCNVEIEHASREMGESSYSLSALISLSVDIMLSFSDKPLKIAVKLGFMISSISFIFALIILFKALILGYIVPGWASTMMSIWFLGGLIIMVLGIVGIYIGKTFNQTKDRPVYIVKDIT